jgi:hypothetical protein
MHRARRLKEPYILLALIAVAMLAVCKVAGAQSSNATSIFSYPSGFSSAGSAIHIAPNAALSGSAVNLTATGTQHDTGALYYATQVNITSFTTDFTFQMPPGQKVPAIMGMTFVIQNSTSSTNPNGSPLGGASDANLAGYGAYWYPSPSYYQYGIGNSVGIKFDMNDANGGTTAYPGGGSPNSTGLYIDGGPSAALVPQDDLNPYGINFYSGHVMAAHIVYDGSLLTMTLRDSVTNAQVRKSWPVNIPKIVGGNVAWVGFTAGEVPAGAINVLTWSYSQGYNTRLAAPTFSVPAASYTSAQTVTINGPAGATIYYTTNGLQPTTSSTAYTGPITVSANTYLQAVAVQAGYTDSPVGAANYQIQAAGLPIINFPSGFSSASNLMSLVGVAAISGSNLQVNTSTSSPLPAGAAWYVAPVNVGSFTTNFTIQIPSGGNYTNTGMTFCIQNQPPASDDPFDNAPPFSTDGVLRWVSGGPLTLANSGTPPGFGYSGYTGSGTYSQLTGLKRSVAIKFDPSGTGLYTDGADVTQNTVTMAGINLTSGHQFNVSLSYNGTTLSMTVTDTASKATFSTSWPINIPSVVGASTAYVGFTAGGYYPNVQQVTAWTYSSAGQTSSPPPAVPMPPTNLSVH